MDVGPLPPLPFGYGLPSGFVRVAKICNRITGEFVTVDLEIHSDDLNWLIRLYDETFELDWRIRQAERAAKPSITDLFFDPNSLDDRPRRRSLKSSGP